MWLKANLSTYFCWVAELAGSTHPIYAFIFRFWSDFGRRSVVICKEDEAIHIFLPHLYIFFVKTIEIDRFHVSYFHPNHFVVCGIMLWSLRGNKKVVFLNVCTFVNLDIIIRVIPSPVKIIIFVHSPPPIYIYSHVIQSDPRGRHFTVDNLLAWTAYFLGQDYLIFDEIGQFHLMIYAILRWL